MKEARDEKSYEGARAGEKKRKGPKPWVTI